MLLIVRSLRRRGRRGNLKMRKRRMTVLLMMGMDLKIHLLSRVRLRRFKTRWILSSTMRLK